MRENAQLRVQSTAKDEAIGESHGQAEANTPRRRWFYPTRHNLALLLLMVIAGTLRGYNLNWDHGLLFHPDEANVIHATNRLSIPNKLDPDFFAYNGFLLYLFRIASDVVGLFHSADDWERDPANVVCVSRAISAMISTMSVALIYLVGSRIASHLVGFWSALFLTFHVGSIQTAHFAVTENLMVFFLLLLLLTLSYIESSTDLLRRSWLIGIVLGLAWGTKTTALAYFLIPLVATGILFYSERRRAAPFIRKSIGAWCVLLAVASFTFCLASPYSLIRYEDFRSSMQFEYGVVSGKLPVFYTIRFEHTNGYLQSLENLVWTGGTLLPLFGCLGLVWWLVEMSLRRQSILGLPLICFVVIYFLYVGSWHASFVRYMLLTTPALVISAAWFGCRIQETLRHSYWRYLPLGLLGTNLAIWSIMFFSIYTRPDTRIACSQWITDHVPPGSQLIYEQNDYPILPQPPNLLDRYALRFLPIHDPDSEIKIKTMANELAAGDYLVLSSRRFYAPIPRAPKRFPLTARYYTALFQGILGYEVCATFTSDPALGSCKVDDTQAEETFEVFDHAKVLVLRNVGQLSAEEIYQQVKMTEQASAGHP